MKIEDFAEMTYRSIKAIGFDAFLPTLCLPERCEVKVLEGVSAEEPAVVREISLAWAKNNVHGEEEFLLAYQESKSSFRIIRSINGVRTEREFSVN